MGTMKWFVFPMLLASFGCMETFTRTARLYPAEPLSTSGHPVIVGKFQAALSSGSVSFTLTDGEVCKGRWTLVQQTSANYAPSGIAPLWDQVYGSGYYLSHVVGTRFYGKAEARGNHGTTLDMEFYQSATSETPRLNANSVNSIIGVASDNRKNIYKLTFD